MKRSGHRFAGRNGEELTRQAGHVSTLRDGNARRAPPGVLADIVDPIRRANKARRGCRAVGGPSRFGTRRAEEVVY